MQIYIIIFLISGFLFFLSDKVKSKYISKVTAFIAIIIPSLLAGLRDGTVGTDVHIYGIPFYEWAVQSHSIGELFRKVLNEGQLTDYGFHILNFLLSRFFTDYHAGLFSYSFITTIFFYLSYKKIKEKYNVPVFWGMLLYYFSLYNPSLNTMRQMIAVSIVFYSTTYLLNNDYRRSLIINAAACLFHGSALFGFLLFFVYLIINDTKTSQRKQLIKLLALFVLAIGFVVCSRYIIVLLVNLGLVRENYLLYLSGGWYSLASGGDVSLNNIMLPALFLIINIYFGNKKKRYEHYYFLNIIAILSLALGFSSYIASELLRLSYYVMPLAYETPILNSRYLKKDSRKIWNFFIIILVAVFWYYHFGIKNGGQTNPYILM